MAEPRTVGERVDWQLDLAREVAEGEVGFFLKAATRFLSPERSTEKSVEMSWGWGGDRGSVGGGGDGGSVGCRGNRRSVGRRGDAGLGEFLAAGGAV